MPAISVGGMNTTANTEKTFITKFCSRRDHAERGVEQEVEIFGQEIAVVDQRPGVGDQALDMTRLAVALAHQVERCRGSPASGWC